VSTFAVQVRRRSSDRWGDGTTGPERTVEGCTRWPRTSDENTDRADAVTTGWMLSAPVGCGITATDEVRMPDEPTWWQVEGDPQPYEEAPWGSDWGTDGGDWEGVPIALTRTKG